MVGFNFGLLYQLKAHKSIFEATQQQTTTNKTQIIMVFVFGKDSVQGKETFPIRSQAPDVTVSVGSGESKQEFKCYKVILSFASEYLDAMLSSGMKEGEMGVIEFPDKDPE